LERKRMEKRYEHAVDDLKLIKIQLDDLDIKWKLDS
jgi:hypothetical protein